MPNDERFFVSGWEDDLNDVDIETNPHGSVRPPGQEKLQLSCEWGLQETPEKEVLWAAEEGDFEKLQSLIESNIELMEIRDKDGYTPLHRACYNDHLEIVKYLLQKGANVSTKSEMEWEPLHSCCQWNRRECAAMLIQHGADVNATSQGGQTPLHIAASHGVCYNIAQMLLLHPKINPFLKNNSDETSSDMSKRSSKYYNVFEMADPLLVEKNLELLK